MMKKNRESYFSFAMFLPTLIVIIFVNILSINVFSPYIHFNNLPVISLIIIILYWIIVAILITLLIRYNAIRLYEMPMKKFAKATYKVARGDFSVYVEPMHTADKLTYLDFLIMDFNKMVEELGSVETLKTDFLSNVSHEIKTPLAIIQNYTELLKDPHLTEKQRLEYIDTISDSTKRLSDLITNILKLNKLEKQNIALSDTNYDICEQLCNCILNFEYLWDSKNIEIDVDIEDSREIQSDPELLELVWNNLLSNAIKFTDSNGTIKIRQFIENNQCIVQISDTGCGIDEDTIKHIFEKFYQGDTSHSTQGNGLGLALVTRILQLLDGKISVSSKLGIGTTFTVSLPIKNDKYNQHLEV